MEGEKVLEVGCGIGTDAVNFARAGARYTGVELSEKSLEIARQRFEVYGLKGTFYPGNAEDLQNVVPAGSYDLVYSFGVLHHTPRPEKAIQAIKSCMTDRSEFRLMMYASLSWKSFMIEAGLDQPEAQSGCPVARTYSHDELRALLCDSSRSGRCARIISSRTWSRNTSSTSTKKSRGSGPCPMMCSKSSNLGSDGNTLIRCLKKA